MAILTVSERAWRYAGNRHDGDALAFPRPRNGDEAILAPIAAPFQADGGMRLVTGNLGRGTFKTSAVDPARYTIEAPARVFDTQEGVQAAFKAGELDRDVVVVVRFQGPRAKDAGTALLTRRWACCRTRACVLVTDGRMSGASGKVPAASTSPKLRRPAGPDPDGDWCGSAPIGHLEVKADLARQPATPRRPWAWAANSSR
jgi:phosphogluconate dehydratase